MRNLEVLTKDYLSKKTDFAVQIVGSWGYGKTFFYRNTLEKIICNNSVHSNHAKNYKPIYISLFGLKSVDDIATKIVFNFFEAQIFREYSKGDNSKALRITQSILKIGLRGFLNFKRLGNVNDYMTDIKEIGQNILDTDEIVICFDDLERKASSLKIEDLTGYINSLVDEGVKVLIIANEDLLLKDENEYKNLKEKIIGITLEFIPDTKKTVESIIETRYSGFPLYKQFLTDNIKLIVQLSNSANNNFRHVTYALDSLQYCYSSIKDQILDCNHDISKIVEPQLLNIATLTFALSIEYKSSNIKYSDLSDYSNEQLSILRMFNSINKGVDKPKSKPEIFLEKYGISINSCKMYDVIFNYVTAYDEFLIENFILEFTRIFNLEGGKILPQYEILNALSYENCYDLSDEDYQSKTLKVIEYAENGQFTPVNYLTIMHYVERFDNDVSNFNLEDVKTKLIEGLKKAIEVNENKSDGSLIQFEMNRHLPEMSGRIHELFTIGNEFIKKSRQAKKEQANNDIIDLLIKNPTEFISKSQSSYELRESINDLDLFEFVPPEKILEYFKGLNGNSLHFFRHFFRERYKDYQKLNLELNQLKIFYSLLNDFINQNTSVEGSKIKYKLFVELRTELAAIIPKPEV